MLQAYDGDVQRAAAHLNVDPSEILDFSSNVTPRPVPDAVRQAMSDAAGDLGRYPDPEARALCERMAQLHGTMAEEVLAGSGSTEFLYAVPRALRPRRVVVPAPCYHEYWRAVERAGGEAEGILAGEDAEFVPDIGQLEMHVSGADMVLLGNPNNPTGVALPAEAIRGLATMFPRAQFLVDESLAEFSPDSSGVSLLGAERPDNVMVLRSVSAFHGLPGLRLGFLIASPETCRQVAATREPWTASAAAQRAGIALLDAGLDIAAMRQEAIAERERVRDALAEVSGLRVFRSQANFLLVRLTKPGFTSATFCERMLSQKILVRNAAGFRGLDSRFARISIRSAPENDQLLTAVGNALNESKWK